MPHRVVQQDISLSIDKDVIKELAQRGYQKEFGARPLARTIQSDITVPISQFLLQYPGAHSITVAKKDDTIIVS